MLAIGSRRACPSDMQGWFLIIVANASLGSRERLVRLLTHPSAHPLYLQYLLGKDTWTRDIFESIPKIDIENPETIGSFLSAYGGIAHCPDDTYIYIGSATSTRSRKWQPEVGEAKRMYHGHRMVLNRGHDEIVRRRTQTLEPLVLHIHDLMTRPGTERFFSIARWPVTLDESTNRKIAALAYLMENYFMIYLGCYAKGQPPRVGSSHHLRRYWIQSHVILEQLRPPQLPEYPWKGANKILPLLQRPTPLWALINASSESGPAFAALRTPLLEYFRTTRATWVSKSMKDKFLLESGLQISELPKGFVRHLVHQEYAAILEDHGLDYMTQSRNRMRKLAILWVAITRRAREMELVDGPLDNRYILEDEGLDWGRISRIALELAPPDLRDMYTKSFCFSQFHGTSTRFFSQQMLYSWNWDRLECKSLYSCHRSA
jgi:hypothetical protein